MSRIHVLSDLLVNKIAAGEVIERPSSVVKELVENSLDAGASRIEVHIEQGGRKLIRVVDDGAGMSAEDLQLCVHPHATSKINHEDDLFKIATMGFRGEALPSIGSVAQLKITSRPRDADAAHAIRVVGSRIEPPEVTHAAPGTSVEVRELFFNVPARQKFLRTPQTEMGHITEQLARMALVYPEVGFKLVHNGRAVHDLHATESMHRRITEFYGREIAEQLMHVDRDEHGFKIHGYIGYPAAGRTNTKWQYLFLNKRFIRDRFVGHAMREAYRGLIDPHRHPVAFLAMEIDPQEVDVNVHPTKVEVRWKDSGKVYSQVLSCLRERLLQTDLTPDLSTDRASEDDGDAEASDAEGSLGERQQRIRESIADFFKNARPVVGGGAGEGSSPGGSGGAAGLPYRGAASSTAYRSSPWEGLPASGGPSDEASASSIPMQPQERVPSDADLAALAESGQVLQVHRSYLVAETEDGLVIIDQHALHERIMFETLAAQIRSGPLESQRLLLPESMDVTPDQLEVIETHGETLKLMGFELTPFGPNAIGVHAVPSLLKADRVHDFLRDLLDRLAEQSGEVTQEMVTNDLISMMACKAAVKAGDSLTQEEIQALLARRQEVERSSNCPHGRPTSLRLTLRDLEKQFKRT